MGLKKEIAMKQSGDIRKYAVPVERLHWICPQDTFQFECTADIAPLKEFIGQDRASDAIKFGLAVERSGYNLFLTGLTGTGKAATIKASLSKFIEERKAVGLLLLSSQIPTGLTCLEKSNGEHSWEHMSATIP